MADTAFQAQYRQEFIAGFEQKQSLLRDAVTTEAVIKGNTAYFLVADSNSSTAVTRGVNGMIPARADNLSQPYATLAEWHDLVRKTNFNVFASQGNQRAIMQMTTMGVINRKIDQDILTALDATTVATSSTGQKATLALCTHAKTILGVNEVPYDGQICAVISPAFEGYLLQLPEFSSSDYVTKKPLDSGQTAWDDTPGYYQWMGVKWIVHPNISGVGTATEKCYMFHKSAIGHAVDMSGMDTPVGYNEEQGYSFARASVNMGSKILQGAGAVQMTHDGSAVAAVSL